MIFGILSVFLAIPLGELKYWSAERQEAYADAEAVMKAEGLE